ncbi:HD domain-containing protein [Kangiella koreensis]|uniref:N-methyl-D-aspartate receptor NMDAR2C subunit n=1 Tax=Kangiella koreensis (strain DSM 16069 / JCM 12317 / KCTC 12182 / SW-125) TaxID=523791 RepID=C7R6V2_KANKD|nr:hypothetical protein [Kangiella koreensis]ACV25618.1 conserved hypothetical protein [Kangiella koreensis DSM 16069]
MNKDRWEALMRALGMAPSVECFEKLHKAYSEKHRFYHTTKHIDAMLNHLDRTVELSEHPNELELAIWFHDAIYKPFSSTNELDSAKWAKEFLIDNQYSRDGAERVYNLIMATQHNVEVNSDDKQLIVDIDLTILGASPTVYDQFEENIRKEYRLVPSIIYRKKRKDLLKSFLSKPSIYNLDYFQEKYESAARANLEKAIEIL